MTDTVRSDRDGAVTTITLNATGAERVDAEMKDSPRPGRGERRVRAVIITGAGDGFCAGQDLREHGEFLAGGQPIDTVRRHYNPIITTIMTMPKPVVAAVNGGAAGAGASLALACDLRVAARGASLLLAFARVGLGPDSGASWTLQRLAGTARAAELLMLAEVRHSGPSRRPWSPPPPTTSSRHWKRSAAAGDPGGTADHQAATSAFLRKERPSFEGR